MFVLSIIKDTVAVQPAHFGLPADQAIIIELNKKYANRVLHEVGLCMCVFDLSEVGEGKVRYGDGCLWYKVIFRLVVFRPFASQVILAKVKSSDEDGIRLTLGFFDDIYIPIVYLPEPSAFDSNERAHFWLPNAESTSTHDLLDSPTAERMYIDAGEVLRVRVEADEFYDDEPGPPKATQGVQEVKAEARRAPYTITSKVSVLWSGGEMQGSSPWTRASEISAQTGVQCIVRTDQMNMAKSAYSARRREYTNAGPDDETTVVYDKDNLVNLFVDADKDYGWDLEEHTYQCDKVYSIVTVGNKR